MKYPLGSVFNTRRQNEIYVRRDKIHEKSIIYWNHCYLSIEWIITLAGCTFLDTSLECNILFIAEQKQYLGKRK